MDKEDLRFTARHIILPMAIGVLVVYVVFSFVKLLFEQFTIIYWAMVLAILPLNYKAKKWTDYVVENYDLQLERNPTVRKMYAEGDFKKYRLALVITYLYLSALYIIAVFLGGTFLPLNLFLIFPSAFLSPVLYDFLNDFISLRKLKKSYTLDG